MATKRVSGKQRFEHGHAEGFSILRHQAQSCLISAMIDPLNELLSRVGQLLQPTAKLGKRRVQRIKQIKLIKARKLRIQTHEQKPARAELNDGDLHLADPTLLTGDVHISLAPVPPICPQECALVSQGSKASIQAGSQEVAPNVSQGGAQAYTIGNKFGQPGALGFPLDVLELAHSSPIESEASSIVEFNMIRGESDDEGDDKQLMLEWHRTLQEAGVVSELGLEPVLGEEKFPQTFDGREGHSDSEIPLGPLPTTSHGATEREEGTNPPAPDLPQFGPGNFPGASFEHSGEQEPSFYNDSGNFYCENPDQEITLEDRAYRWSQFGDEEYCTKLAILEHNSEVNSLNIESISRDLLQRVLALEGDNDAHVVAQITSFDEKFEDLVGKLGKCQEMSAQAQAHAVVAFKSGEELEKRIISLESSFAVLQSVQQVPTDFSGLRGMLDKFQLDNGQVVGNLNQLEKRLAEDRYVINQVREDVSRTAGLVGHLQTRLDLVQQSVDQKSVPVGLDKFNFEIVQLKSWFQSLAKLVNKLNLHFEKSQVASQKAHISAPLGERDLPPFSPQPFVPGGNHLNDGSSSGMPPSSQAMALDCEPAKLGPLPNLGMPMPSYTCEGIRAMHVESQESGMRVAMQSNLNSSLGVASEHRWNLGPVPPPGGMVNSPMLMGFPPSGPSSGTTAPVYTLGVGNPNSSNSMQLLPWNFCSQVPTPPKFNGKHQQFPMFAKEWEHYLKLIRSYSNLPDAIALEKLRECLDPATQKDLQRRREANDSLTLNEYWRVLCKRFGGDSAIVARREWEKIKAPGYFEKVSSKEWREFATEFQLKRVRIPDWTQGEEHSLLMDRMPRWAREEVLKEESKIREKGKWIRVTNLPASMSPEAFRSLIKTNLGVELGQVHIEPHGFQVECGLDGVMEVMLALEGRTVDGKRLHTERLEKRLTGDQIFELIEGRIRVREEANEIRSFQSARELNQVESKTFRKGGKGSMNSGKGKGGDARNSSRTSSLPSQVPATMQQCANTMAAERPPLLPQSGNARYASLVCYFCGQVGHIARYCSLNQNRLGKGQLQLGKGKGLSRGGRGKSGGVIPSNQPQNPPAQPLGGLPPQNTASQSSP